MRIEQVVIGEHIKYVASVWTASGVVLMLGVGGRRGRYVHACNEDAWSLRKPELGPPHK